MLESGEYLHFNTALEWASNLFFGSKVVLASDPVTSKLYLDYFNLTQLLLPTRRAEIPDISHPLVVD